MYVSKWYTLAATAPILLSAGLAYTFSIYAEEVKQRFQVNQTQLESVGSSCNLGGYSGILAGLVYDYLEDHHKLGPRLVLLIGAAISLLGYTILWAAITGRIAATYWQLLLIAVLACNGGTWSDTAGVATNLRNFPNERGMVVGVMKSFVGLSASVYTTLYQGFFLPDAASFVLCLGILPALINVLCSPLMNHVPFVEQSEGAHGSRSSSTEKRMEFVFQVVGALALYQVATALLAQTYPAVHEARTYLAFGTILLACLPFFAPWGLRGVHAVPLEHAHREAGTAGVENGEGVAEGSGDSPSKEEATWHPPPQPGAIAAMPNLSPLACLASLDFWLLFAVFGIGAGTALVFLNNSAQLVHALGGQKDGQDVFVSVFSVCNCAGRLGAGYFSETSLHKRGTPRPLFMVGASGLMAGGAALAAASDLPSLYLVASTLGFAFGAHWSLVPALTSELFGLNHFATNYNLIQIAPAAASFGMAAKLAGWLYSRALQRHPTHHHMCLGADCFRPTFLVVLALQTAVVGCAAWLHLRTRHIYGTEYQQVHQYDEETHDCSHGAATPPGPPPLRTASGESFSSLQLAREGSGGAVHRR